MLESLYTTSALGSIPIIPLTNDEFTSWINIQPENVKNITASFNFAAKPNKYCLVLDANGKVQQVLLGIKSRSDLTAFGILPEVLPANKYRIEATFSRHELEQAAIAWGLGAYKFSKYKKQQERNSRLVVNDTYNYVEVENIVKAIYLARDVINIPACDLCPQDFAKIACGIAKEFKAKFFEVIGNDLIKENFPAIFAVGKSSENSPRLIEMHWNANAKNFPRITLVGKGVCFDSGGLNIKSPANMYLMKKDIAGGAHALALAQMIMTANLPLNLRVIIPLVENLISGRSYKPGDVIKTRKGLTVEVRDTDAEGRLILADALAFAMEEKPDVIINFASLTGAARVALGSKIAALFSNSDELAEQITKFTEAKNESVWRLPLYEPYRELLRSNIADLANVSNSSVGAGAITAALFLQEFVSKKTKWMHLDITAYNFASSPSKPEGGDVMCLQGIFQYLKALVSPKT